MDVVPTSFRTSTLNEMVLRAAGPAYESQFALSVHSFLPLSDNMATQRAANHVALLDLSPRIFWAK